jgi:hypothetical protein
MPVIAAILDDWITKELKRSIIHYNNYTFVIEEPRAFEFFYNIIIIADTHLFQTKNLFLRELFEFYLFKNKRLSNLKILATTSPTVFV